MSDALEKITLKHPAGAELDVYYHGAHITRWRSASGRELMFLSRRALLRADKAIRGGVPLIFPQFNAFGPGPRHGFARVLPWTLSEIVREGDVVSCRFELESAENTLALWPHPFRALYSIELRDSSLRLSLEVNNTGVADCKFTAALHTYFRVHAFSGCKLEGLNNKSFWDNDGSDFSDRKTFDADVLDFSDAIDRVYFDVKTPLVLHDGSAQMHIEQSGFGDVVVWNPGLEGARAMNDMADDEYQRMVCVEAARIDNPVSLKPGETWTGEQYLREILVL